MPPSKRTSEATTTATGAPALTQKPAAPASSVAVVPVPVPPAEDERRRKERVEEIGREDAWFKQSTGEVNIRVTLQIYSPQKREGP